MNSFMIKIILIVCMMTLVTINGQIKNLTFAEYVA